MTTDLKTFAPRRLEADSALWLLFADHVIILDVSELAGALETRA